MQHKLSVLWIIVIKQVLSKSDAWYPRDINDTLCQKQLLFIYCTLLWSKIPYIVYHKTIVRFNFMVEQNPLIEAWRVTKLYKSQHAYSLVSTCGFYSSIQHSSLCEYIQGWISFGGAARGYTQTLKYDATQLQLHNITQQCKTCGKAK